MVVMADRVARWKPWAAGLAVYVVASWCLMPAAEAWPEAKKGEKAAEEGPSPTKATRKFYGVSACNNPACHADGTKPKWDSDPICRCDEAARWTKEDKHSTAYAVLKGPRGELMEKNLAGGDKKYRVTEDKRCLACHAAVIDKPEEKDRTFKVEDGVSCVVCHGEYKEWIDQHSGVTTAEDFRKEKDRKLKWTKHGMRDLWDPYQRAELCTSCHVGNLAQNKFVTHEMYAAGHPPLPSFELATFSNEMPRHWEYLREKKSAAVRKELGYREDEQEETLLVLAGAAVSLKQTMRLMVDELATSKSLDLSHFDCAACHHDLKANSWRQKRGYAGGKPGRVPPRYWSPELVQLAIDSLPREEAKKKREEFKKLLAEVGKALDAQPYGAPALVKKAGAEMASFADGLARRLKGETFKAANTKALLGRFPELYFDRKRLLDFDSTRQVVWAYEVLHDELVDPLGEAKKKRFREKQATTATDLHLRLGTRGEYEKLLSGVMKTRNDFDPTAKRTDLLKLGWPLGK
jgi:hypothetical protein